MRDEYLMFFRSWIAEPLRVAAITPSGNALAELITQEITPYTGCVIELGPGTGVFTAKLLERGVKPEDLTLIEYGSDFARYLNFRFPRSRVLWMDASRLRNLELQTTVNAVISGLPLLSMPTRKIMCILDGAFSHLKQGGAFYQFTYSLRCPIARPILERLGLRATLIGRAMLNVPPASVYRITRRRERRGIQREW